MILALILLLANADPASAALPELDAKVCQMIIAHQASADVEYKSGVDVHGKPVVEADINQSPVQMPEKVTFDITVDLAKFIGITAPDGVEGQAKIGTLEIDNKGGMTFGGKPLEDEAAANLREMCAPKQMQKIKLNAFTE